MIKDQPEETIMAATAKYKQLPNNLLEELVFRSVIRQ